MEDKPQVSAVLTAVSIFFFISSLLIMSTKSENDIILFVIPNLEYSISDIAILSVFMVFIATARTIYRRTYGVKDGFYGNVRSWSGAPGAVKQP